jgi:hypothetical protein
MVTSMHGVTEDLADRVRRYAHVEQEAHAGVPEIVETDGAEASRLSDLAPAKP